MATARTTCVQGRSQPLLPLSTASSFCKTSTTIISSSICRSSISISKIRRSRSRTGHCSYSTLCFSPTPLLSSSLRYPRQLSDETKKIFAAASSASGYTGSNNENPYQVLGVNPLEKFEKIKATYTKQYNDAKKRGDESAMSQLERAYDQIMMTQLSNRKQGLTFGSLKVSKEIRYADRIPLFPWVPRYALSNKRTITCNFACSMILIGWAALSPTTTWKSLQFLIFYYFGQMFLKLRTREPQASMEFMDIEEEEKTLMKTGKILLRSLCLVFSCIAISSFAYTGVLNVIEYTTSSIPYFLVKSQELIVTTASAIALFFMASFFR